MRSVVKILNAEYNRLDAALKWLITGRHLSSRDFSEIDDEVAGHFLTRRWKTEWPVYSDIFGIIDGKASALLTHISIMIAINTIFIDKSQGTPYSSVVIGLLIAYIVAGYLALRCLRFWSFDEEKLKRKNVSKSDKDRILHDLKLRDFFQAASLQVVA